MTFSSKPLNLEEINVNTKTYSMIENEVSITAAIGAQYLLARYK